MLCTVYINVSKGGVLTYVAQIVTVVIVVPELKQLDLCLQFDTPKK